MKATARPDRTHNPFDETCWVSRLRENLTSGSDGEGLETGRRSTLTGHAGGNPGYRQGHSYYALPRQSFTRQLIFKSCKNSLNADAIPSADPNIIESLLLASIAAHLSSQSLHEIALHALSQEKELAVSFQRTIYVFSVLKTKFINCILNPIQDNIDIIAQSIFLMINELYDPNYRKRETSKTQIYKALMNLNTV